MNSAGIQPEIRALADDIMDPAASEAQLVKLLSVADRLYSDSRVQPKTLSKILGQPTRKRYSAIQKVIAELSLARHAVEFGGPLWIQATDKDGKKQWKKLSGVKMIGEEELEVSYGGGLLSGGQKRIELKENEVGRVALLEPEGPDKWKKFFATEGKKLLEKEQKRLKAKLRDRNLSKEDKQKCEEKLVKLSRILAEIKREELLKAAMKDKQRLREVTHYVKAEGRNVPLGSLPDPAAVKEALRKTIVAALEDYGVRFFLRGADGFFVDLDKKAYINKVFKERSSLDKILDEVYVKSWDNGDAYNFKTFYEQKLTGPNEMQKLAMEKVKAELKEAKKAELKKKQEAKAELKKKEDAKAELKKKEEAKAKKEEAEAKALEKAKKGKTLLKDAISDGKKLGELLNQNGEVQIALKKTIEESIMTRAPSFNILSRANRENYFAESGGTLKPLVNFQAIEKIFQDYGLPKILGRIYAKWDEFEQKNFAKYYLEERQKYARAPPRPPSQRPETKESDSDDNTDFDSDDDDDSPAPSAPLAPRGQRPSTPPRGGPVRPPAPSAPPAPTTPAKAPTATPVKVGANPVKVGATPVPRDDLPSAVGMPVVAGSDCGQLSSRSDLGELETLKIDPNTGFTLGGLAEGTPSAQRQAIYELLYLYARKYQTLTLRGKSVDQVCLKEDDQGGVFQVFIDDKRTTKVSLEFTVDQVAQIVKDEDLKDIKVVNEKFAIVSEAYLVDGDLPSNMPDDVAKLFPDKYQTITTSGATTNNGAEIQEGDFGREILSPTPLQGFDTLEKVTGGKKPFKQLWKWAKDDRGLRTFYLAYTSDSKKRWHPIYFMALRWKDRNKVTSGTLKIFVKAKKGDSNVKETTIATSTTVLVSKNVNRKRTPIGGGEPKQVVATPLPPAVPDLAVIKAQTTKPAVQVKAASGRRKAKGFRRRRNRGRGGKKLLEEQSLEPLEESLEERFMEWSGVEGKTPALPLVRIPERHEL